MKTCVPTVAVALCFVFVSHQFGANARFGVGWVANGRPGVQSGAAHRDGHFQEQSRSSEVMKPLVGKRLTDLFDFGFFLLETLLFKQDLFFLNDTASSLVGGNVTLD